MTLSYCKLLKTFFPTKHLIFKRQFIYCIVPNIIYISFPEKQLTQISNFFQFDINADFDVLSH
jgi:hypothetical protein